jgi:hypothetical protein
MVSLLFCNLPNPIREPQGTQEVAELERAFKTPDTTPINKFPVGDLSHHLLNIGVRHWRLIAATRRAFHL